METYTLYHGSFESCLHSILEDGFICSNRCDHWLGEGIYFYDEIKRAYKWAKTKSLHGNYKNETPVVILVNVELEREAILDLCDEDAAKMFSKYIGDYNKEHHLNIDNLHISDVNIIYHVMASCLLESYCAENEKIKMIKSYVRRKSNFSKNAMAEFNSLGIVVDIEKQYCIIDQVIIKNRSCFEFDVM